MLSWSEILLVVAPAAACVAGSRVRIRAPARATGRSTVEATPPPAWPAFLALPLMPVFLLALAHRPSTLLLAASVCSAAAACYGGWLVLGPAGALAVGGLTALVWVEGPSPLAVFDAVSASAALAVGAMLFFLFGRVRLGLFLAALVPLDIALVALALPQHALLPASLTHTLTILQRPPVFAGVVAGPYFLGGLDLACAVAVGAAAAGRRELTRAVLVLLAAQLGVVLAAHAYHHALPATVPSLLAFAALYVRFGQRRLVSGER
jgi:hypothetical protein